MPKMTLPEPFNFLRPPLNKVLKLHKGVNDFLRLSNPALATATHSVTTFLTFCKSFVADCQPSVGSALGGAGRTKAIYLVLSTSVLAA
jgi:hypothetical protein